jgi:hypothetical protein
MSMSPAVQPLHILRKDALHLWPETLISIALLAAYAWTDAQTWVPIQGAHNVNLVTVLMGLLVLVLVFLITIAWLVLTSRLVHDEELVGDRQFWITRPYTWYSLLGAKVLYLAVFIGIPFLTMQMWLLHHAGMYPTHLVPALLLNLLWIAAAILLPLLVLAAVTATFIRYISSVLAGVIYLIVVVLTVAYNWSDRLDAPFLNYLLIPTLLAILLAALFLQYARRKTLIARILLLALPLVFVVFALLSPANLLTEHRYPDVSVGTITFDDNPVRQQPAGRLFTVLHKVDIQIPVQVQLPVTTSDETDVVVQRIRATIDGPNGFHYASDWTSTRASFGGGETAYVLPVSLPEKVFEQIHNQPVAVHFQLGTQTYNVGTPYTISATEAPFPIPGNAACLVSAETGGLECRFPYTNPEFVQVTATVHSGNCLTPGPLTAPAYGALVPSAISSHFSPVELVTTSLSVGETKVPLCPGTSTTFKPAVAGAYGRMHLDIPAITLDPYALRIPVRPQPQPNAPATQQ